MRIDGDGQLLDDEPVWFADADPPDLSADGRMLVYESRAAHAFAPRVVLHMLGSDEPGADTGEESGAASTTFDPDTSGEAGGGDGSGAANDGCGCRGSDRTAAWWLIFVLPLVRRCSAPTQQPSTRFGDSTRRRSRVAPRPVTARAF